MTSINSDNSNIVKVFSDISEIILDEGGFLHPDVRIVENSGDLIVESSLPHDSNDVIFDVPESCLFDTNDVEIELVNEKLVLASHNSNLTNVHVKICKLMLDLFNLTGKIDYHKKTFPLPLLNNPSSFELISKKCPGICSKHKRHTQSLPQEQVLVKSFLGCRQLNIQKTGNKNAQVLMPFIDSLNHHVKSTGIDMTHDSPGSHGKLQIKHSKPVTNSDECFVNYGPMDPMVRYFHFGYVDMTPYQMQSIPMILDISGIGRIMIKPFNSGPGQSSSVFSDSLNDIRQLLPNAIRQNESIFVWRLFIPVEEHHDSLKRILEELILNLAGKKLKPKKLAKYVVDAENKIIKGNLAYSKEILSLISSEKLSDVPESMRNEFSKLAKLQISLLNDYQKNIST